MTGVNSGIACEASKASGSNTEGTVPEEHGNKAPKRCKSGNDRMNRCLNRMAKRVKPNETIDLTVVHIYIDLTDD